MANGEIFSLPRELVRTWASRRGRSLAGVVATLGFLLLVADLLAGGGQATRILAGTWLGAGLAYGLTFWIAPGFFMRHAERASRPTGDAMVDMARIDAGGPVIYAATLVHRKERSSFIWPLVAISLLAPLSLHLIFSICIGWQSTHTGGLLAAPDFNQWILWSMVIVGHSHAVLAALSARHVVKLQWELDHGLPPRGSARGGKALLWTVASSGLPGALLLFIPPFVVAITGALFVPWMFHWAKKRAQRERAILARCGLITSLVAAEEPSLASAAEPARARQRGRKTKG